MNWLLFHTIWKFPGRPLLRGNTKSQIPNPKQIPNSQSQSQSNLKSQVPNPKQIPNSKFANLKFKTILLFSLILIFSCAQDDRQLIAKTLQRREKALEKKDLNLYRDCISPAYRDPEGQDLSRLQQRFTEVTEAFASIDFEPERTLVYQNGSTATVIQDFVLRFQPQGEEPFTRKGRERIVLRKEAGTWKIIEGL
jgi:ketosteroid isomerase-like protein